VSEYHFSNISVTQGQHSCFMHKHNARGKLILNNTPKEMKQQGTQFETITVKSSISSVFY